MSWVRADRARHRAVAVHMAAVAVVGLVVSPLAGSGPVPAGSVARPGAAASPMATLPAGTTATATVRVAAPRYPSPGAQPAGTVPATWYGRPMVLPVLATQPGWVQVRLPQRPNGTTGWLRAGDVTLGSTPYRIVVDLATTQLKLYERDQLVLSAPAGVGAPDDPTPTGQFFVAFRQPSPGPGYGPFILVTSAHSETITDWGAPAMR